MSNNFGDRYLGHGDQDTRLNSTGNALDAGKWVVPTGDETIDYADVSGSGGKLVGVLKHDLPDGERDTVHYRGVVYARVESSVSAGDELAAPDSGGTGATTPGVAGSGGSSGIIAVTGAEDDGNGNYAAYCLLR